MAKPTEESAVKRDLRTPKYKMRVEESDKTSKLESIREDEALDELEDAATCVHGYLAGCPYCKQ